MKVRTNEVGGYALRQAGLNETKVRKELSRLSSSLRINQAADDESGLTMTEKMRALTTGLSQVSKNAQEGVSLIQTAEGALQESHAMLQRMKQLALRSMNGTYEEGDRINLDSEYQNLISEMDHIAQSTHYNGIALLDGSLERVRETAQALARAAGQAGDPGAISGPVSIDMDREIPAGPVTVISEGDFTITGDGVYELAEGYTGNITVSEGLNVLIRQADSDQALRNVSIECQEGSALHLQDLNIDNDADIKSVKFVGGGNMLELLGENRISNRQAPGASSVWQDPEQGGLILQIGEQFDAYNRIHIYIEDMTAEGLGLKPSDIKTIDSAGEALDKVMGALNKVSEARSGLGSYQSRLENAIKTLNNTEENLTDATSRIRDLDVAKDIVELSKANICNQTAQSLFAHTAQRPTDIVSLLQA